MASVGLVGAAGASQREPAFGWRGARRGWIRGAAAVLLAAAGLALGVQPAAALALPQPTPKLPLALPKLPTVVVPAITPFAMPPVATPTLPPLPVATPTLPPIGPTASSAHQVGGSPAAPPPTTGRARGVASGNPAARIPPPALVADLTAPDAVAPVPASPLLGATVLGIPVWMLASLLTVIGVSAVSTVTALRRRLA